MTLIFTCPDGIQMYTFGGSGDQNRLCIFESNSRLVLKTVMTSSFALVENLATLTKDVVTKCNYKLFCLFSYHNH